MKTIGLLGGMSWESTAHYYQTINTLTKETLGGLHSAKIAMISVDFAPIEQLQHEGNWAGAAQILAEAAQKVEAAGADFLVVCTNTMHKVIGEIEAAINIPVVHIADATAETLLQQGIKKTGLLATAFTMEQDFYKGRLQEKFGLEVITPNAADRKIIHDVIYQELCLGEISEESRGKYLRIMAGLKDRGAESVILGCTEIGLLVKPEHTNMALVDTTLIHAKKAVELALM